MNCAEIVEAYLANLREGFACTSLDDDRVLITSPYSLHDGDSIEVIVTRRGSRVSATDFATTLSRVELSGTNVDKPTFQAALRDVLAGMAVDILDGELRVEGQTPDLPSMLTRLFGVIRDVDGLVHLRPSPRAPLFERRVLSHIRSQQLPIVERPLVHGHSGSEYRITAEILEPEPVLLQAVAGGGGTRSIDHAYRIFSDVNSGREKVVVLSPNEPWRPEDVQLLVEVCWVAAWWERSALDAFLRGERPAGPTDRRLFASQQSLSDPG